MKTYHPDKRSLNILKIIIAVIFLIFITVISFLVPSKIVMLILNIIMLISAVFIIFIYLPIYFSHLEYFTDGNEILKKSGVFFRTSRIISVESVQYTSHAYIPFSENSGFHFIIFHVFGGKMLLLFLKKKDADEIIDIALKKEEENGLS